jgi:flagellar biosynthesis protein FliQ
MYQLTYITQQALVLVVVCSAPPVLMSLVVGFLISVFQATTQIQEQTLSFAPKVVIVFGVLGLAGAWIGTNLLRFTFQIFDRFPYLIGGH